MKKLLTYFTIATVTMTSALTIARAQETVEEEVLAAQKRFYQAYESCNAEAMEPLVTDDMMYLHSTGGLQNNKTELLESLTPDCFIEVLRVDVDSVRIYGDAAVLFGDLHFKGKDTPKVQAKLRASQVFVKQDGQWLFASNSSMEPVPLDTSIRLAEQQ
jgi:ketosteroid isomerase-like protein